MKKTKVKNNFNLKMISLYVSNTQSIFEDLFSGKQVHSLH